MTKTHHLVDPPCATARRASGTTRTKAGTETLARSGAPIQLQQQEHTLTTTTNGRTEGAADPEQRRPGAWPAGCQQPGQGDELWMQLQAERARRDLVLGSIRHDLAEQPSPRAVRAAGRRWCHYITALADDIATAKQQDGDR